MSRPSTLQVPTCRPRLRSPVSAQTTVRAFDPRLQKGSRLRPARLVIGLTRVRHLRRGHALEPDVHAADYDGVAVDHARPADQALGGYGR
jgi:hypothetical protein